jgi:hypothetical protein
MSDSDDLILDFEGDEAGENDVRNSCDGDEAYEDDKASDEVSEVDSPSSNPTSQQDVSSVGFSSAQSVSKGAKGQLFKTRSNQKPSKNADMYRKFFFGKLGGKAEHVLREFSLYNNKKDQALADMILRNTVREYQITKRVAQSVFGIGWPRWKRVMSSKLVMAKEDIKFVNVKAITDDDLNAFKEFIENLQKEPGYPCNHRRQKL